MNPSELATKQREQPIALQPVFPETPGEAVTVAGLNKLVQWEDGNPRNLRISILFQSCNL
jgi:hypothetical protein